MSAPCPQCGCIAPAGGATHALMGALRRDDLDRALDLGLLGEACCAACSVECRTVLQSSRRERLAALSARARYRARALRLEQRAARGVAEPAPGKRDAPSLPPAAAAALARAKAKAAGP